MNIFAIILSLCISVIVSYNVSALSPVRITEIMYDPSGDGSKEFIEFYNGSDTTVSMAGWSMYGVDFIFPGGSSLSAGAYTVIARNMPALQANHPGARISGQYSGKLKGTGELIRLQDGGGNVVSQVSYSFGGAWPSAPRNGGPSLSLIWPNANETIPGCWGSSTAIGGSPSYANNATGGGGCSTVGYPVTPPPPPPAAVSTPNPAASSGTATNSSQSRSSSGTSSKQNSTSGASSATGQANQTLEQKAAKIAEQKKQQTQQKQQAEQKKSREFWTNWLLAVVISAILGAASIAVLVVRRVRIKKDAITVIQKGAKSGSK